MSSPVVLGKFSLGMGDRFAHQAKAQLRAVMLAAKKGVEVTPVWNKSNREHTIIGSQPSSVRAAAEKAVRELGWTRPWHVDADHIRLETVNSFVGSSDFFTIDVADSIGKPAPGADIRTFAAQHPELAGRLDIPGIARPFESSHAEVARVAGKYLAAVKEAGQIYRHIAQVKGAQATPSTDPASGSPSPPLGEKDGMRGIAAPARGDKGNARASGIPSPPLGEKDRMRGCGFITEISMDETDAPQTPPELLIILAAMADEKIPLQTIAPKFTGRFNKGVDYVGDLGQFEREFNDDLAVIAFAIEKYGLPKNLKLSVHSGSDKFSLYPIIHRALAKTGAGLHLKTAGTTWLEEVIGLAESGGEGLALAKEIYAQALEHRSELCAPYATVIDIDPATLPSAEQVAKWTSEQFAAALRHDPICPEFNPHFRQLLHVGFKIAAKMGSRYLDLLVACEPAIARNVTANLFERHLKPLLIE